jgi:spermidine/putrescine transport system substrate-binding protein
MNAIRSLPRLVAITSVTILLVASCAAPGATPARPASAAPTVAATAAPTVGATAEPTVAATAEPTVPATEEPVSGSLAVLEWDGYQDPLYWADFQAKYPDIPVNFTFGISDADIYGKMKAGDQSDIFHAYTGWLQFYVDEGLVAEIDTSKLANWDKVPDSFKAVGMINGKQYFVPFDWGFTSILYRTDQVDTVDSWSALFDEAYDDHISMWDDGPGAVTVSTYIHGWDETNVTPEQLEQAKQEWIDQAPLNRLYWASEYGDLVPAFQSNEVWLAYAWQGAYATLLAEGMPVAYAEPSEGRNSWVGVYGINADSPNYELALRYLDEQLGETTGNNLVSNFYYGHTNGEVMAGITDETLKEAFSIDDPTILERTNFTPNLTAQQRDDWTQMWAEVKASQ